MNFIIKFALFSIISTIFLTGCSVKTKNTDLREDAKRDYVFEDQIVNYDFQNSLIKSLDKYTNKKIGGDCSGFISILNKEHNFIYFDNNEISNFFASGRGKSQAIYNYFDNAKRLSLKNPKIGDLVFFFNTTKATKRKSNISITHIGVVRQIFDDGRISFIHNSRGKNIIGYMNLNKKDIYSNRGKIENSHIIVCNQNKISCLASNRFAGYGKISY